jgi:stage IV sporulation protein FB
VFDDPARTQADLNFSLFGIPVRVHPMFWLMAAILGSELKDPVDVLSWVVAVFLSIIVHELGHALVIRAYGHRPWIVLHAMGGLTIHDRGYMARSGGSGSLQQIVISVAGPVAGFLLAGALLLGFVLTGHAAEVHFVGPMGIVPLVVLSNMHLALFIFQIFYICVMWGLVNLLPIYPLDGGQIAREVLLKVSPGAGLRQSLLLSIIAAGGMAAYGLSRKEWFIAMFFGYLAYNSYAALTSYGGRSQW